MAAVSVHSDEQLELLECSEELENGTINVNINKAFTPWEYLSGSCNEGFIAVSGQLNITCNAAYQTRVSDTCRKVLKAIAVGKPTEQSSTYLWYDSGLAVDGNRSSNINDNSCSHTDLSDNKPWWRVDLLKVYYIISVKMVNRGMDQYGYDVSDRLRNVTITTGENVSNISTLCGLYDGPGSIGELVAIDCPPSTTGRYVKISLVTAALTLCEVDVFAVPV
ncbi:fucolectin-1-like [Saccostrea echinata]|uniref:fucolectin-1-like n=1 Tax=Saccostrea echinata TaxID=191078 RepID=UPI002A82C523|nr:fucolectin-1-like [Saccostrea echinata]